MTASHSGAGSSPNLNETAGGVGVPGACLKTAVAASAGANWLSMPYAGALTMIDD